MFFHVLNFPIDADNDVWTIRSCATVAIVLMATVLMLSRRPLLRKSIDLRVKLRLFLRPVANEVVLNKAQQNIQARPSMQTSLAWVQIYNRCPTSYGVGTFEGYHEMISTGSALPIEKSTILENALPYLDRDTFPVYFRHTLQDAPVLIDSVELQGLTMAERGMADVKVTMRLKEDLVGNFTVQDMHTQKTASIEFDGKVALHTGRDHVVVV